MSAGLTRVAIIGSTSGIASAVADALAADGVALTLVARNAHALEAQASDIRLRHSVTVSTVVLDLDDAEGRAAIADLCAARTPAQPGPLSGVLLAAGYMADNDEARSNPEALARTVSVNYAALAEVAESFARVFAAQGSGVVAGIGSVAGDRGRMSNYVYGSAKAAFGVYLDGLRHRLTKSGAQVAVLTIKPGMVDTPMTHGVVDPRSPLVATPEKVGGHIARAMKRAANSARGGVVYTPRRWRWIMLVIRLVPERLLHRTGL